MAQKELAMAGATDPNQLPAQMAEASAMVHSASIGSIPLTLPPSSLPLPAQSQTTTPAAAQAATPATSAAAASSYTPPPFNSLANSVAYIQHQIADSSAGLPQTYYNPSGTATGNQVIDNGVGTYDTSLALMALIQSDNSEDLSQAQKILNIYNSGVYGPPPSNAVIPPPGEVLTAYPTGNNGQAFKPFNSSTYYYFDEADANGEYESSWNQYGVHTGPNAWLALADCQFIQAERKAGVSDTALTPYLNMAAGIGNAMILLQNYQTPGLNDQTQGAVRYGPHQTYEDPFETVNTENNVDAYSAFNSISQVMKQSTLNSFSSTASSYLTASGNIINWLQKGSFYNPGTGQMQTGMRDPQSGLLFMGADFDSKNNRWQLETQLAEDSGGSWTISALGPQTIDSIWGPGAALTMWTSIRANFGRTEGAGGSQSITDARARGSLTGVDYSNLYASNQALISPEWTAGAVNALKQLIPYYQANPPPPTPKTPTTTKTVGTSSAIVIRRPPEHPPVVISPVMSLTKDEQSMENFLSQGVDSYAIGPGLTGSRQGNTGFGWEAPLDDSVAAMASIYGTLGEDPLALWRTTSTNP
jgi:hypothetical protein